MKTKTFALAGVLGLAACESDPVVTPSDTGVMADLVEVDRAVADAPAADTGFSCASLGSLCHDVDPGSGPIHDCHEGGHDANPAWCAANAERCYQLCTAAHANVDGGARDGATSHDAHATTDASATDAVASDVHQH
jgi:hypothetical protein